MRPNVQSKDVRLWTVVNVALRTWSHMFEALARFALLRRPLVASALRAASALAPSPYSSIILAATKRISVVSAISLPPSYDSIHTTIRQPVVAPTSHWPPTSFRRAVRASGLPAGRASISHVGPQERMRLRSGLDVNQIQWSDDL
jgi:hypothetical protein